MIRFVSEFMQPFVLVQIVVMAGSKAKAMKKPMKALTKGKPASALTKGKTKSGSSTDKKVKKTFLKKGQLEKLGKMTLAQKVAKATEHADTAEEAAQNLKGMLNKSEHSRVWSKFNVMMNKKTTKEKKAYEKLSKTEKGMQAALQLVISTVPKFMQTKESVGQHSTLDQRESEAKMIQEFGEEEFYSHVDSGRIIWRADPWTSGVYNYRDLGDIVKHTKVRKTKEWNQAQEYEADENTNQMWSNLWSMDATSHLSQVDRWGKGNQKGLSLTKGKGKGQPKGKGKGRSQLLALEDGNPHDDEDPDEQEGEESEDEDEAWRKVLGKAKRARDQCNSIKADCEAALEAAEKAKRVTKATKKDADALLQKLNGKVQALKQLLGKKEKAMCLAKAKDLLLQAGAVIKEVKEESKELNQLGWGL